MKYKIVISLILTYILLAAHGIHANGSKSQNVPQSAQDICPIKVGQNIPKINLETIEGEPFDLNEAVGKKPTLLIVYRGGWCPYCNAELRALQEMLPEITDLGATLVAISPETPDNSLSTTEKNALTFEVLSDQGNRLARDFGLVFSLPDALRPIYEKLGIDLAATNGDETFELPVPATFVIDGKGVVRHAFVDADYTQRLDPVEVVDALRKVAADN